VPSEQTPGRKDPTPAQGAKWATHGFDVHFDQEANALYFRLNRGTVATTFEWAPSISVDLDEAGRLLGVEVLNAAQFLSIVDEHGGRMELPGYFRRHGYPSSE
jgi:uncharacterized protein YuzE